MRPRYGGYAACTEVLVSWSPFSVLCSRVYGAVRCGEENTDTPYDVRRTRTQGELACVFLPEKNDGRRFHRKGSLEPFQVVNDALETT